MIYIESDLDGRGKRYGGMGLYYKGEGRCRFC